MKPAAVAPPNDPAPDYERNIKIPDKCCLLMLGRNQHEPLSDYNQLPVFHLSFQFYPEK